MNLFQPKLMQTGKGSLKIILFFIACFCLTGSIFAQEGLYIGGKIIPTHSMLINNSNKYTGNVLLEYEPWYSYGAGLHLGYNFIPPLGVHADVIYSAQNVKHSTIDTLATASSLTRQFQYLKVPIFFHINSAPKPVMFSWEFGPQFGFLLGAKHIYEGPGLAETQIADVYNDKDLYKGFDFAIATNFGWDFYMADHWFFNFHFRVDYSFSDVENKSIATDGTPFYSDFRSKTQNFTAGIELGVTWMQHTDKCRPR